MASHELPSSARAAWPDAAWIRSGIASIGIPIAIVILLALSVARTYSTGQNLSMYDNPIYRWRESLAIALSRMQPQPLHGYIAYRSISNYLNQHGLGIFQREADPLPTAQELSALTHDGPRMEKLIREAIQVPIDMSLPPVILHGNEKGLADFYYFAFELFGLNINALVLFYYLLLAASVAMFFATFRGSSFCMFLLALYLIGHFFMVGYANAPYFQTVHNSRFFPVLAMLPTLHLLLLVLRREQPTPGRIAAAIGQTALLYFCVFIRYQAIWQAGAIIVSPILVLQLNDYAASWRALRSGREGGAALKQLVPGTWPAIIATIGLVAFILYSHFALDPAYRSETTTHTFWDGVLTGTISADPELYRLYGNNDTPYGDLMAFDAVGKYLRERHDTGSKIAFVVDGVIYMDPFRNEAVYEKITRRLFFEIAAAHPWLTIKSFLYGKPRDQIGIFKGAVYPYLTGYKIAFFVTLATALLTLASGAVRWEQFYVTRGLCVIALLVIFSSTTTLMGGPTMLIVDTLLFYTMLSLFMIAYLPVIMLSAAWSIAKRKRHDSASQLKTENYAQR